MNLIVESLVITVLATIGAGLVALVLKYIFDKGLNYRLFTWMIPGLLILIMNSYVGARMGGLSNPMAMLITFAIGMAAVIVNFIIVGKYLVRQLQQIAGNLSTSAEGVGNASSMVASSSQSLAEGASEQASSLEETSSSIEELTSMTKQNADNAQQAKGMMTEAQNIVSSLNRHMNNMADAIAETMRSSEQTGKIIKTIDEISFQTNLLALNAAVEAARAGESGAGFAVVADEVRNLARRAAEAAKSTSNLIEKTINSAKNGDEMTKATRKAFQENIEISSKIGSLIDEIAAASTEQAHGIGQINIAVAEMDKITQTTAASAEESASAAQELNIQAMQMEGYVAALETIVFGRTEGNGSERTRAAAVGIRPLVNRNAKSLPVSGVHCGKASSLKKGKSTLSPKQLIPLEDGERSFQNFES